MENKPRRLKALGRAATLGTLYDARSDEIINVSLFKKELPDNLINTIDTDNIYYELTMNDSYQEKFNKLQIDAELKLSLMAGLFKLEGSGKYLSDVKTSYKSVKSSIIYELKTKKENVHLSNHDLKEYLSHSSLEIDNATHVICGIQWGANTYCSFEYENTENEDKKLIEGKLNACLNKIAFQINGSASVNYTEEEKKLQSNLHIKFNGDIVAKDKDLPQTYQKVLEYIRDIPNYLKEVNNSKGIQLEYELIPLSYVQTLFSLDIKINRLVVSIEKSFIISVEIEMDNFLKAKQKFNDFKQDIEQNKAYFSSKDLTTLLNKDSEIRVKEIEFKEDITNKLIEIRSGKSNISELKDILAEFLNSSSSPNDIELFLNNHEYMKNKLDDIKVLKDYGIEHLKKNSSPRNLILQNNNKKVYILFYTTDLKSEIDDWKNNFDFMKKLTRENKRGSNSLFYLCDIELNSRDIQSMRIKKKIAIHYYLNDKLINDDYYESEKEKLQLAFAKSDKIDHSPKPEYPCLLSLKCPLWNKTDGCLDQELNWKCLKCNMNFEYGYDEKLYCNCGSAKYDTFLFKCSDPHHPDDFVAYPVNEIKKKLDELKKNKEEFNLLLLGETGVGKSTLINALINYVNYDDLEDAIQGGIKCIVPTKFTFMGHEISAGEVDKNENLKNDGGSATQFPKAHVFTFGNNKLLRIIDTPGIGDTRGLDKDKINIDNILKYISNYEHLNAICIMLKPNVSRLTVALRYCMKELLTHLHKEARNNIVFLFTNSRSTFYQPGDTDAPLKTLLSDIEQDSKIKIPYNLNNTFCYDNEAFRFLCITKNIHLFNDEQKKRIEDSKKDYKTSWEQSVATTFKLLKYVGDLKIHNVKETISLNEAKRLINSLAKPIAEITRTIIENENLIKNQLKEIEGIKASKENLEKFLYVDTIVLEARQLGYPRTVCTNHTCIRVFKFDDKTDIDYITHCHSRCYLSGVSIETVNNPQLKECAAMNGKENCQVCGCLWNKHMHITYECKQVTKKVVDEIIKKNMEETEKNKEKKKGLINDYKNLIKEYENEKSIFIQTSAEIANFVKLNSICVFNDDLGNYLDLLIKEEESKMNVDSSRKIILSGMQDLKKQYEEKKKIFLNAMGNISNKVLTVDDVQAKINDLYKLQRFGKNLEEVMKVADYSHRNVFQFKEEKHNIPISNKKKLGFWDTVTGFFKNLLPKNS